MHYACFLKSSFTSLNSFVTFTPKALDICFRFSHWYVTVSGATMNVIFYSLTPPLLSFLVWWKPIDVCTFTACGPTASEGERWRREAYSKTTRCGLHPSLHRAGASEGRTPFPFPLHPLVGELRALTGSVRRKSGCVNFFNLSLKLKSFLKTAASLKTLSHLPAKKKLINLQSHWCMRMLLIWTKTNYIKDTHKLPSIRSFLKNLMFRSHHWKHQWWCSHSEHFTYRPRKLHIDLHTC